MKHIAAGLTAATLLTCAAAAMPSDLPWQVYGCAKADEERISKAFAAKFLSDGMSIDVLEPGAADSIMVRPVDDAKQEGFKPGPYKGEGDVTLTLLDGTGARLEGRGLMNGPYPSCVQIQHADGLWQSYACDGGRQFEIYFDDEWFVTLRLDEEEFMLSRKPEAAADVIAGTYASTGNDLVVSISPDNRIDVSGEGAPNGPYENCRNLMKP